jgi:ADP-dependent NAD(P)H-hydrate dehydratase / NAD(P)H-hydrate epimerase
MGRIEQEAYEAGASERAFMVNAGNGIAGIVYDHVRSQGLEWSALILCGKGNNGGDAYVAGARLLMSGLQVRALQLGPCSPAAQEQRERFEKLGGEVTEVASLEDVEWPRHGVVVDGLFGTGFHGQVDGLYREVIQLCNEAGLPTISIDIPSGINGNTGEVGGIAVKADITIYLGLPKLGFFSSEAWNHVGKLRHVNFGIDKELLTTAEGRCWLVTQSQAASLLPPIVRSRHKYEAGYVVGIAGSKNMPGAAVMAGEAALRSGAGMVRIYHAPDVDLHHCGLPPEVIAEPLDGEIDLERASALFIGPGLGTDMAEVVGNLLPKVKIPCLLDADALTMLAKEGWKLPEHTILTPHRGEMSRLLDRDLGGPLEFLELCEAYAHKSGAVCVLKGGPTFIFEPSEMTPLVVQRGDPGMATAGAGDVLTGVIAALLAQGVPTVKAAALGVYLHGVAGELAAQKYTSYGVKATDLIERIPEAIQKLALVRSQSTNLATPSSRETAGA